MALNIPLDTKTIVDRSLVDIQRSAADSNAQLRVSYIKSIVAAQSRRQFDLYQDFDKKVNDSMPHTANEENALKWGGDLIGNKNAASKSSGVLVAQGIVGGSVPLGHPFKIEDVSFLSTSSATIALNTINVLSITRTGTTATVTTSGNHNLSSFVPVTVAGAGETQYNVTDVAIIVISATQFTYEVSGSPATPATGTITTSSTYASVPVESSVTGIDTNFNFDSKASLQSPITDVNNELYVNFGEIGGGANEETIDDYIARYLFKMRNPVANFNKSAIVSKVKEITGVTRVFVDEAGTTIGSGSVTSITRSGNIATVTTSAAHGLDDGQEVTITGAVESDYNVTDKRIIVESTTIFHFIVQNSPTTPATGTILHDVRVPLGQVITYFMRDNDDDAVPTGSEVNTVKAHLDTIRPATTSVNDNIVSAPLAVPVNFVFTSITPNNASMRDAIKANITQFFEEETSVGVDVDEDAYRSAIKNSVVIETGETLDDFVLVLSGDVVINNGEIATKGTVTF